MPALHCPACACTHDDGGITLATVPGASRDTRVAAAHTHLGAKKMGSVLANATTVRAS